MDEKNWKNKFSGRLIDYINVISLPLILAVLFVIQNLAFNKWLDIYSKTYFARLCLVTFALGVVFYGPVLLFNKRYKYIYLFLVSFIASIIFVAQFLYYSYSQSFLQFSAIMYAGEAVSVSGTIKTLITPQLLLFFVNIVIVLIGFAFSFRKKNTKFVLPKWEKVFFAFVMIVIIFFGYRYLFYMEKREVGYTSSLYTDVFDLKYLVKRVGVVNFFLEDFTEYVMRANLITADDKNFLQKYAQEKKPAFTDISANKYFGVAKGKNVIIIQIESLENVVINKTIYNEEITPNLNKLAKEGRETRPTASFPP
ncbi:MAG: hypothetical protein NT094_04005 [Candidatus Staskawiczbacteria bacterium]|nr:hypothetical protein [Candidatus Staskawiczbacteria bacterium]